METMKVRVFSSSEKAQCRVPPITQCTTQRLLGLKSIYPQRQTPWQILAKWDWDFSWQTHFTFLPNRGHHSTRSAAAQWRAGPGSTKAACFQRSSRRSVVGLNNRSKLTVLQTWRYSFPHSHIGHWDLALTAPEFQGNMPGICLIGFECWYEDRLCVKYDGVWQMCVVAFALASHL